jgi:putative ABC transport system permease protein
MRYIRNLQLSVRSLLAHRTRSVLAALGIAIGTAAVFLTSAVGEGAKTELAARFGEVGTCLLVVRPAQVKKTPARKQIQGYVTNLKYDDFEAIAELPGIESAAPVCEGAVKIQMTPETGRGRTERGLVATQVLGTTSAFFRARHYKITRGRWFDQHEESGSPRVAVLGGRLAANLFPDGDAVGRDVRIGGTAFEVIGTLGAKGMSADGSDADNQVFVPVRTAMRRVFDARSLNAVFVGVRRSEDVALVESAMTQLLRERHRLEQRGRPSDFTIQNQLRVTSVQQKIAAPLTYFCSGLAALSLIVGGAGILALMLLSVQERRWEIGLRVAVGATSRDIFWLVLAEALVLAITGGAVGVACGALGTWVLGRVTHWVLSVSVQAIAVSLTTAAGVGLLFGASPARQAALLPPAQALVLE